MRDLYQVRNPNYSETAEIHKATQGYKNNTMIHDINPYKYFSCKDLGFITTNQRINGHIEKVKTGRLETIDLLEEDLKPDDAIVYNNEYYIVQSITFEDEVKSKNLKSKPQGKMTIEVRK